MKIVNADRAVAGHDDTVRVISGRFTGRIGTVEGLMDGWDHGHRTDQTRQPVTDIGFISRRGRHTQVTIAPMAPGNIRLVRRGNAELDAANSLLTSIGLEPIAYRGGN